MKNRDCWNPPRRDFGVLDHVIVAVAGGFIRQLASRAASRENHYALEAHPGSIVNTFLEGCNFALGQYDCYELIERLNSSSVVSREFRGFAFNSSLLT